jgi:hypothetical protein
MLHGGRDDSRSAVIERPRALPRGLGVLAAVLLAAAEAGCKGCHEDHPYVPYTIALDAAPGAPAPDAQAEVEPERDGGAFAERAGQAAPSGATHWSLSGFELDAPQGMVFEVGVTGDFGAGPAAFAVVRGAATPEEPGALVFYKASGARPDVVVRVATGAGRCAASRRLVQVPGGVVAELGLGCPAAASKDPSRLLIAASAGKDGARVKLAVGIVDPPAAPTLGVSVDLADRDGDGVADVGVRVTLEGGDAPFEPAPRASAVVRWLDRPAGLSRDPDEPDASLRVLAAQANVRAASAKTAASVPPLVRQIRALFGALCAEGGAPRLLRARPLVDKVVFEGPAAACGPSRGLEEAGLAAVRAAATEGNVVLALAALERAQRAPATRTPTRAADAVGWIEKLAPPAIAAEAPRAIAAVPDGERGRKPAWGPLAFEGSGKLLVRTAVGVVRVDPATGDETDAADVRRWPLSVTSPDGARSLLEVYDACDGVALHATLLHGEGDVLDVPLPVSPTGAARCGSARGEPAPTVPIAWGAQGLELLVLGEPLLVSDASRASALRAPLAQPVTLGAPRSPNGASLAVPSALGLLVRGPRTRLLRARELDGTWAEQHGCVVSDDGARAACVRAGRAWVGRWDEAR